jgi:membrane dipeptidase
MGSMSALLAAAPLIDGHNDLLWALREAREKGQPLDPSQSCPTLHTDLPRLIAGGVRGQFWSVYVPSDLAAGDAVTQTLEQIDGFFELVERNPRVLEQARTADDIERIAASGRVASMIGVEGGHSIGGSLGALRILARLGAGYMTLTHNDDTPWADSATGERTHGGLTRFGEEVVRELNRQGILVDLSHVSDDTMRHAIAVSDAPAVFSHSSARSLCDVPRNVPDDVLELAGRNGTVVQVTFVPWFLTREGAQANAAGLAEWDRLKRAMPDDADAVRTAMDAWFEAQPIPPSSLSDVADHIDHIREIAGIDAVGIGSDFDGVHGLPDGLSDVSRYPTLFEELAVRGYTDEDLTKIAGRNVLRVMREAERVSSKLRADRAPSTATIGQMDG